MHQIWMLPLPNGLAEDCLVMSCDFGCYARKWAQEKERRERREITKHTANQLQGTFSSVLHRNQILPKRDRSRQRRSPWPKIARSKRYTNRTRPAGFSRRAALKEEIDETRSEAWLFRREDAERKVQQSNSSCSTWPAVYKAGCVSVTAQQTWTSVHFQHPASITNGCLYTRLGFFFCYFSVADRFLLQITPGAFLE